MENLLSVEKYHTQSFAHQQIIDHKKNLQIWIGSILNRDLTS